MNVNTSCCSKSVMTFERKSVVPIMWMLTTQFIQQIVNGEVATPSY